MSEANRAYKQVQVLALGNAWQIALDGKHTQTPAGKPLAVPSPLLAEAVANEWRAQEKKIDPNTMPRTRLVTIALDRVPEDRAALVDEIVQYGETDLLCYRAQENALALKQVLHFDPILEWAYETHGMVFDITSDAAPIVQPEKSLEILRRLVSEMNDLSLAAMAMATPILGSALLALALKERHISPEFAIQAARIEETFAAERYGEDPETEAKWAEKLLDIQACSAIFTALA